LTPVRFQVSTYAPSSQGAERYERVTVLLVLTLTLRVTSTQVLSSIVGKL
jgi:hypothetical protein